MDPVPKQVYSPLSGALANQYVFMLSRCDIGWCLHRRRTKTKRKKLAMKLKLNRTMLICMSSALVAGAAFAQNDPITPQGGTSTQPGSTAGRDTFRHGMMRGGQDIQASKLMGAQVKSSTGETLGTINDFVVNPQFGRIEFAVLSVTGPTGTTPTGV